MNDQLNKSSIKQLEKTPRPLDTPLKEGNLGTTHLHTNY